MNRNIVLILIATAFLAMSGSALAQTCPDDVFVDVNLECGDLTKDTFLDNCVCYEVQISCGKNVIGSSHVKPEVISAGGTFSFEAEALTKDSLGCELPPSEFFGGTQGMSWGCDMPDGQFNLSINQVNDSACAADLCGDGIVQKPEQCDDSGPSEACTSDCKRIR